MWKYALCLTTITIGVLAGYRFSSIFETGRLMLFIAVVGVVLAMFGTLMVAFPGSQTCGPPLMGRPNPQLPQYDNPEVKKDLRTGTFLMAIGLVPIAFMAGSAIRVLWY